MDFKIKNGVLEARSYSGPGGDVVIPDDVVKLEKRALETNWGNWGKKAIKSVTIPASVVEIESGFEGNTVLEKISVDPNNPVFEVRNNMLVNKKENKIVLCVSYDKKELVIDDAIGANTSGKVDAYIYYDGADDDVKTTQLADLTAVGMTITFTATPVATDGSVGSSNNSVNP